MFSQFEFKYWFDNHYARIRTLLTGPFFILFLIHPQRIKISHYLVLLQKFGNFLYLTYKKLKIKILQIQTIAITSHHHLTAKNPYPFSAIASDPSLKNHSASHKTLFAETLFPCHLRRYDFNLRGYVEASLHFTGLIRASRILNRLRAARTAARKKWV